MRPVHTTTPVVREQVAWSLLNRCNHEFWTIAPVWQWMLDAAWWLSR